MTLYNKVEYKALIQGIELARDLGARKLMVHSDSQLAVELVNINYKANKSSMVRYLKKVR